jgi:hypothetical protein
MIADSGPPQQEPRTPVNDSRRQCPHRSKQADSENTGQRHRFTAPSSVSPIPRCISQEIIAHFADPINSP